MSSYSLCTHCEDVRDPDISNEDRHLLFHQECDNCAPDASTGQEEPLCSFCKHLRLRHVLFCPGEVNRCEIRLGSLRDVETRLDPACVLCGIIHAACKMVFDLEKSKAHPLSRLTFGMDLLKADVDVAEFAPIHLWVYDESGDPRHAVEVCRVYARPDGDADFSSWPFMDSFTGTVGPLADWDRARGWLSRCCTEHDKCKHVRLATPPPGFRVIDVESRKLVCPQAECRFVALSYVWGSNPDPSKLQTTMSNVDRLEKDGALKSPELPAAIDEAMQVCRELGERYLWADRLCIVQDDPVNKTEQILSMVDIYSSAVLDVALCAGASTDDSIPGVGTPRPPFKKTLELDGLLLTTVLPTFGQAVTQSTWASRGWTYQEAALPTRILYLTPFQLLYECRAGHVYEDNFLNDSPWSSADVPCGGGYQNRMPTIRRSHEGDAGRFESYRGHIRNYNSRLLTYSSDIYNAFAGAMSALYGKGAATHHGLPLVHIDQALLWYPDVEPGDDPPSYRACADLRLPTWSWSSVEGSVTHFDVTLGFKGSIIRWARICDDGTTKTFEPISESDGPTPEEWDAETLLLRSRRPQLYLALAAAEGCVEAIDSMALDPHRVTSFDEAAVSAAENWPQYRDFRRGVFGGRASRTKFPDAASVDGPAIAARAQAVKLGLGGHVHERSSMGRCDREDIWLEIRGPDGACIGMLAPSPAVSGLMPPSPGSEFEFIGISISSLPASSLGGTLGCLYSSTDHGFDSIPSAKVKNKLGEVRHLGFTYWDAEGVPLNPIPVVNVMLIERKGMVGTRVSVGWVLLTQWARLERRYEFVVLV